MATLETRGYVNGPEAKKTPNGKEFSKFRLSCKQKKKAKGDQPEKVTYATYWVTDWNNPSPPSEGSYVQVKGYLDVNEVEKDGAKRTYLEVNAQELEVIGAGRGDTGGVGAAPSKDPWDE